MQKQHLQGITGILFYDTWGNIASILQSDNTILKMTHDSLNRLECTIDPLGRRTTNLWDDGDNLVGVINAAGERSTYNVYDGFP
jgi:YD repeat-containing protein